jgi:hypothetical protein
MGNVVKNSNPWLEIARYAQRAPSPHNTQPFRLKVQNLEQAEVVFLPRRGLYVADPLGRFTWLTAGIFVEICSVAAHSLGFELDVTFDYSPMYANGDVETPQTIARLRLIQSQTKVADLDARLILDRQTSRLPYDGSVCSPEVIDALKAEAQALGHSFETRVDPQAIDWVIELNKQALFHDIDDADIRTELTKWLRFSSREEDLCRDGLSARCMMFSGMLLRSFFMNHEFWRMPVVRDIVGKVYGSTMKGIGTIGWLRGRYVTNRDWVAAGKVMIRLWLILTRHGYYWHPYGSVITSENARQNMIRYLNLPDEAQGENMVWLLLRLGRSGPPPVSYRLPLEEIALCAS